MKYTDDEWFKERMEKKIEENILQENDDTDKNKKDYGRIIILLSAGLLALAIIFRIISQFIQIF